MINWIKSVLGITDIEEKQNILDAMNYSFEASLNALEVEVGNLSKIVNKPKRKRVAK